tara:strand:+ start:2529 stop:3110 length:582 start_codon:yes stop_codon:yes gene_type:complete
MSHLGLEQRYEIYHLCKQETSYTDIAKSIGVHKPTISRELRRNSDQRNNQYKVTLAQNKYRQRQLNKPKFIRSKQDIKDFVVQWLKEDYSPDQILGYAKILETPCVSVERIYKFIWLDKKQGGTLYKHLRTKGKRYQKRGKTYNKRGQIPNRVAIEKPPEIVDQKQHFGDLEIDLVIGKNHKGALLTINDRAT